MAKYNRRNSTGYGFGTPLPLLYNRPVEAIRVPAVTDTGYDIGQVWIDIATNQAWFLTSVAAGVATWALASPGASDVDTLTGDAGGAISPAAGNITLAGGTNIATAGGGNTITFNLDAAITLATSVTSPIYTSAAALDINAPAGQNITIQMGDAVGGNLIDFEDSASATVATINSNGQAAFVNVDGILGAVAPAAATATTIVANTSVTSPLYTAAAADALIQAGGVNDVVVRLGDAAGGTFFRVQDSTTADVWTVDSNGVFAAFAGLAVTGAFTQTAGAVNIGMDNLGSAINIGGGNVIKALAIGGGAAAHTIAIGSAAAGAFTIDTAAGFSIDGANTSNITVTSAGLDLNIQGVGCAVNMTSTEAQNDAIVIESSAANGGVQIRAGTGGILIGNEADTQFITLGNAAPTVGRIVTISSGTVVTAAVDDTVNIATGGATTNVNSMKTVNINTGGVTLGEVKTYIGTGAVTSGTHTTNIDTGNRAAGTMATNILTGTGTKTFNMGNADGLTTINLDGITLINDGINVQTSINTGASTGAVAIGNAAAGAMTIDTAAGISLDAATASNFTVTGAGLDLTLNSVGGSVNVTATQAAADAILIDSIGGGIDILARVNDLDMTATLASVNILANEAVADSITINAAGGGMDITAGVNDLDIVATLASVNITANEDAADAVVITSSAGGIDIAATGAAGQDIDITNTGGSVNITATENIVSAIIINASGVASGVEIDAGTGGINLNSGLIVNYTAISNLDSPYTPLGTDYFIGTDSTGAVIDINLPAAPVVGRTYVIYDRVGQAAANRIRITGVAGNVTAAGATAAFYELNTAYESISVTWNGVTWSGRAVN